MLDEIVQRGSNKNIAGDKRKCHFQRVCEMAQELMINLYEVTACFSSSIFFSATGCFTC